MDIDKQIKEVELHGQVQMIEGHCRALYRITDGKQEVTEGTMEAIHDICKQMLDKIERYYTMEAELRKMS